MAACDEYYGGDGEPVEHRFNPYEKNGGSVVAIGGPGFVVIASDTRLSRGFSILTRDQSKLTVLGPRTVLGCTGCWCDALALIRLIKARFQLYKHEHQKDMSVNAAAQMLATMLYNKRFFPYGVGNTLAGLDEEGNGVVYSYDSVGHKTQDTFYAGGSSGALLQSFLDNQVGHHNMQLKPTDPLTIEKTVSLVKDMFTSAAERDIKTGDGVIINIITKDGIREERYPLRQD